MRVHHEYDFLVSAASTHDLYQQHTHDTPEQITQVRAALRDDSRPEVRRNAVVALTAALKERSLPDCIPALDDPTAEVATEAAAALATYGPEYMNRPQNTEAIAALKKHAPSLRAALSSKSETVRFNAAMALRVIADAQTELALLLRDDSSLVRREGLALAVTRTLGPPDVAALDDLAHKDPDQLLRTQAVNTVVNYASSHAMSVLTSALERGDVDNSTATAVETKGLTAAIPAIIAYLPRQPKDVRWLQTLTALKATCAASAIATLLSDYTAGYPAEQALRSLSGHPEWSKDQLATWAKQQPSDVAPCATASGNAPKR